MADIILFFPSAGLDIKGASIVLPLPVLCVAAPLVKAGYTVKIIDQRLDKQWQKQMEEELRADPLCVGVSAMTGKQIRGGLQASAHVKKLRPDIPVVWGGIHASLLPKQTAANPLIDIVVIGEGERTFLELVSCLEKKQEYHKLPGICFKAANGCIVKTARRELICLDDLPELPYQLIDPAKYTTSLLLDKPELSHFASRGCPYDCAFCYNVEFNKQKWRMKSPGKIVAELKKIEQAKAGAVSFADEELFISKENIKQLCRLLRKEQINLQLMASCRINDLLRFDEAFLRKIIEAGFAAFYVGVESGSDRVLRDIKKRITKQQVLQVNNKLKNLPIDVYYSFMCGFPGETKEEITETINLMLRLYENNPRAYILPIKAFTPYPGTELFDVCKAKGFSCPQKLEEWTDFKWHVSQAAWLDKKTKRFINIITYLSIFMDEKHCLKSKVGKKIPLISLIALLYASLMRFRLRHGLYFFNPDIMLFKAGRYMFLVSKNIIRGITCTIRKMLKGKDAKVETREDIMGKQNTVVLIGADEKTVEIIREALPDWQASKIPVSEVKEKISVLADNSPALIMLKAHPEKEKTLELCNQINTALSVTDIPLLVTVDRRSQVTQVQYILKAGADKCIISPLEKEDLKAKIKELVA